MLFALVCAAALAAMARSNQFEQTCQRYAAAGKASLLGNPSSGQPLPLTNTKQTARIVVVGGGLAGLTATDSLLNLHGFTNVQLLEAGDRLGGRVRWEESPSKIAIAITRLRWVLPPRRAISAQHGQRLVQMGKATEDVGRRGEE